jgi:hypothetical protein
MMTARRSQLWPLAVALVAAIEADGPTSALLASPGVFNTSVPKNSALPYAVIGFAQESGDSVFGAYGTSASQQIDIWGRNATELGNREVLGIYDALYALLHEQPLAMTGFRYVIGTLSLIALMPDPDGETLHCISRYQITSRQA